MNWWMEKPYRMVQNNLRDIDGAMDVDYEVDMLKKLGANVVQVGCGGISAYGPSQLACQRPTPYLQGDKFGEIVEKCHAAGIRVIARFDISKVHKDYLQTNPDWFTRRADGDPAYFEDCAAVCVNGAYRNEFNEVISRAAFDGTFVSERVSSTSPEFGTDGGYAKCWLREKDEIYLYKGGSALYEVEPLSEYLAAQLAEQICPSYTAYDLSHHHGKLVSKCNLFTSESQGLAKAGRIFGEERTMEHFKAELIDYLYYYNNRRIKLKLKGLTPAQHRYQTLQVA